MSLNEPSMVADTWAMESDYLITIGDFPGGRWAAGEVAAIGESIDSDWLLKNERGVWVEAARLSPTDVLDYVAFGRSALAIDNGTIAVGAWYDDEAALDAGAVYVYSALPNR